MGMGEFFKMEWQKKWGGGGLAPTLIYVFECVKHLQT